MLRRRRLRPPVLSRLSWAWLSAFVALTALGVVFLHSALSGEGPGRIALPVDDIEYTVRVAASETSPEERLKAPPSGLRLAAPGLRDEVAAGGPVTGTAEGEDSQDILLYPEEYDIFADTDESAPGEIVITIDGKPQGANPVLAASLGSSDLARPIPDPSPGLLRSTPLGKIPRIAPDGRKALNVYAKPFEGGRSKPRVAIIVGGLGLNSGLTERAIDELPAEISLAFAPYAKDLEFWTRKARKAGHEILIELPMEGYGPNQEALGAAALLSTRTEQENLQRLDWLMSRFGGYFAATNYMGAKFSANDAVLKPVLKKLREAGVGYIDDTGAALRAGGVRAAVTTVDKMISPAPSDDSRRVVRRELKALEQIAQRDGAALGKTYAYAVTLDEIVAWADALEEKGLSAAPASTILRSRTPTR